MADENAKVFRVKVALRHNGKDYAIGKKISLSVEEAAAIGADVVEPMGKQEEK